MTVEKMNGRPIQPTLVEKSIREEATKPAPRRLWLVVDGGGSPLFLNKWHIEQGDDGEAYLVDTTRRNETRIIVAMRDVVVVKFYNHDES